jgi:hypothetical protein
MLKISMNPMQLEKILPTNASLRCSGEWTDPPCVWCSDTRVLLSYSASLQRVLPLSTDEHDVTTPTPPRTSENAPSTHSVEGLSPVLEEERL